MIHKGFREAISAEISEARRTKDHDKKMEKLMTLIVYGLLLLADEISDQMEKECKNGNIE